MFVFFNSPIFVNGRDWPNGLGIVTRIGSFLVQIPLGTRPSLVTQPCYDAPSDIWAKQVKTQWLSEASLGEWVYPPVNGWKLVNGQRNSRSKKKKDPEWVYILRSWLSFSASMAGCIICSKLLKYCQIIFSKSVVTYRSEESISVVELCVLCISFSGFLFNLTLCLYLFDATISLANQF